MEAVPIWTTVAIASPSRSSWSGSKSPSAPSLALLGLHRLEQLLLELGLALAAPVLGEPLDLLLGDERALDARRARLAGRAEQHVALPEQRLGAVLVEDHARVGLRGDRERDPRRHVRLDHAGDHVGARALGGEHQVDAHGARLLRQPDDRVLHVGGRDHHQVGELVDHAQDVRAAARSPWRTRTRFSSTRLRVLARLITP